jgi:hypothetical protein
MNIYETDAAISRRTISTTTAREQVRDNSMVAFLFSFGFSYPNRVNANFFTVPVQIQYDHRLSILTPRSYRHQREDVFLLKRSIRSDPSRKLHATARARFIEQVVASASLLTEDSLNRGAQRRYSIPLKSFS